MRTLIYLIVLVVSGCATGTLPKPPQGEFCTHWQEKAVAICNDIGNASPQNDVPVSGTDKWIMLSPDTWESIQNYIDQLKLIIKNQAMLESGNGEVKLTVQDIEKIQKHIARLKRKNNEARQ